MTKTLAYLHHLDSRCHWCLVVTCLITRNIPKGIRFNEEPVTNQATIDHLFSKRHGNAQRDKGGVVLACYHCNFQRNNAEQKGHEIETSKGGFALKFLPSGEVLRDGAVVYFRADVRGRLGYAVDLRPLLASWGVEGYE